MSRFMNFFRWVKNQWDYFIAWNIYMMMPLDMKAQIWSVRAEEKGGVKNNTPLSSEPAQMQGVDNIDP